MSDRWSDWHPKATPAPVVSAEVKAHLAARAYLHGAAKASGNLAAFHYDWTRDEKAREDVCALAATAMDTAPTGDDWTRLWDLFVRVEQGGLACAPSRVPTRASDEPGEVE